MYLIHQINGSNANERQTNYILINNYEYVHLEKDARAMTDVVRSDEESDAQWDEADADGKEDRQHCARSHDRLPCRQLLLLELCI